MERVYVGLTNRVSGSMGGGVRVGRAVGVALELGAVADINSEGVGGWKQPMAARVLASGRSAESGGAAESLYFWSSQRFGWLERQGWQTFSFGSFQTALLTALGSEARR